MTDQNQNDRPGGGATAPAFSETILLVDDDPAVLKMVRLMLSSFGYTVLEASSGQNAIAAAEKFSGTIDLLVTDVIMPRMSGVDLFRKLKAARPKLKVIYITGDTADAITDQGIALDGKLAFLFKPFDANRLCEKVRALLDSVAPEP